MLCAIELTDQCSPHRLGARGPRLRLRHVATAPPLVHKGERVPPLYTPPSAAETNTGLTIKLPLGYRTKTSMYGKSKRLHPYLSIPRTAAL